MSDRWAFRALVALAGLLIFCLGCILIGPLQLLWLGTSMWLICCSLMAHAMPMSMASPPSPIVPIMAWLLLGLMVGNSAWAVWRLWWSAHCLTRMTRMGRLPHPPLVARLGTRLDLTEALVVVSGRRAPVSFCYGLWRPRICLSLGLIELLTEAQLVAVLSHEAYHLRRREPLRMAVAICLSRLLFFAPLITELHDHYLTEKELAVDAAAVTATSRAALAGAMHQLITAKSQWDSLPLAAVAGLSVTAQRVNRLINPLARSSWTLSLRSIVLTLAVFVISCLSMVIGLL